MDIKLSDTQHAAIQEVSDLGYTVAKANTIKSLEGKGLIYAVGNTHHKLTDLGREYLGLPEKEAVEENFHQKLMADVAELEKALSSTEFDKFDDKWDAQFKITAGFGETLNWKGTEVWNGSTAAEIKEDMETATPINRKARRTHFRTLRNAYRRLTVERPRKQFKITGKVGV